jgi:hypothetical protein
MKSEAELIEDAQRILEQGGFIMIADIPKAELRKMLQWLEPSAEEQEEWNATSCIGSA